MKPGPNRRRNARNCSMNAIVKRGSAGYQGIGEWRVAISKWQVAISKWQVAISE